MRPLYARVTMTKWVCVLVAWWTCGATGWAQTFVGEVLVGAWEQTDDRLKPVYSIRLLSEGWFGRVDSHPWTFGPIHESQLLFSAGKYYPFLWPDLHVLLGAGLLSENTQIHSILSSDETSMSVGAVFGIRQTLPLGTFHVVLDWTSSLFPAGLGGGLLLAFGRKQALSVGLGGDW